MRKKRLESVLNGAGMLNRNTLYAALFCLALGCIGPAHPSKPGLVAAAPEHVLRKDADLGIQKSVKAGEVLVQIKDFWTVSKYPNAIQLKNAITINAEDGIINLPHGRVLTFTGMVDLGDVTYLAYSNVDEDSGLGEIYYLRPDLTLAPFLYRKDTSLFPRGMEKIVSTWPETVRFKLTPVIEPYMEKRYQNYDLLFRGQDADGIHITYREYPLDGAADPTRTQSLTFPVGSPTLRWMGTVIKVHECTANRIVVTVVSH
jgi:hypothetical protein